MKRMIGAVVVLMSILAGAYAATTWTGAGGDNRWTNAENWSDGVPKGAEKEDVVFPEGNWTVEIDADAVYNQLIVTNGAGTVTFTGTHALAHNHSSRNDALLCISDARAIVIAGPTFEYPSTRGLSGNLSLLAGSIRMWKDDPNYGDLSSRQFLTQAPPKGSALELASSLSSAIATAADVDYDFGGDVSVTNGGFYLPGPKEIPEIFLTGRGCLTVKTLRHIAAKSNRTVNFDLERLTLGAGGIEIGSHTGYIYFRNGIHFGAFANWSVSNPSSYASTYYPCGDVSFDTLDAFDSATPHTIVFDRVNLSETRSLAVSGGGSVSLPALAAPDYLSKVELKDATALSFGSKTVPLLADRFEADAGATLTLDPMNGQLLDAKDAATLPAGSIKLVSTVPASPAHRYPVFFAPAGTDPDLSVFDTTGVPSGYTLEKRNNAVYLTDGTTLAPDLSQATDKTWYWVGGTDASWKTAANWSTETALDNSTNRDVYLDGWTDATMQTGGSIRLATLNILTNCGPVRIENTGANYIRINNGTSIVSDSAYPVVIDSNIGPDKGNNDFGVYSRGAGSIAFLKDIPNSGQCRLENKKFIFCGDVRLGGQCLGASDLSVAATESLRPNRFSLLSGAAFAASAQKTAQNRPVVYDIAANATMTISGTSFAFSGYENSHIVNGTLAVNCPFSAAKRQTFDGTGTVHLASVAAAAGGVELSGGVTLVPGDWTAALPLSICGMATIAPAADWVFNPGGDVTLAIDCRSTLTVDTGAHTATFSAPITGDGNLVKKGAGKLVFAAVGNVIDTLTIDEGTVGPDVALVPEKGYAPFLTVRTVVGSLTPPNGLKLRAVANLDGTMTYSAKKIKGLCLLVR